MFDDTDPDYIGGGGVTALIIEGSPGKDKIRIDPSVTQKIFHTTTGSDTVANPLQITHITVNAHDGDDQVDFGVLDPADGFLLGGTTINGGGGNDILIGTPYPDTINGGDGDDAVTADDGDDTIDGGEGNDDLGGGEGDDHVYGGPGADKIYA